jgi:hypothetical protein
VIIGFLKTHKRNCKMKVTAFRNMATHHNRLLKAAEISLLIPRKLLHPYCLSPGGGGRYPKLPDISDNPLSHYI